VLVTINTLPYDSLAQLVKKENNPPCGILPRASIGTSTLKALASNGHHVHFITYSQPARLDFFSANLFYHEVSVSKYPLFDYPPYELALASKLVDVVRFENLDILHVHYAIPHRLLLKRLNPLLEELSFFGRRYLFEFHLHQV
jgi:hypothetical protein